MAEISNLKTHPRPVGGSLEAKRLRKKGLVPAIIYGHKEAPEQISVIYDELEVALQHRGHTYTLDLAGKQQTVLIQDVQRCYLGKDLMHVDFLRVSASDRIHAHVPIVLRGQAVGARSGGVLIQPLHTLHIECLVASRPETITVRVDELQLGQAIHVRELQIPEGVKVLQDPEAVVVQIKSPSAIVEAVPTEPGANEPEVITKKKEKAEDEE